MTILTSEGRWFECSCAHTQVRALLVSSAEAWRRVSTSCQESAHASGLATFAEVSGSFALAFAVWLQAVGAQVRAGLW